MSGRIKNDPLFLNSLYLMVNTILMAGAGFLFWLLASRLFTTDHIGIATTLISAMGLISYASLFGFNSTFIRYLPTTKKRSEHIATGSILAAAAACIIAAAYCGIVPLIAPKLSLLHEHPWYAVGFVILSIFSTINLLTDSIFIAFRAAKYNVLIDGMLMSGIRLVSPFILVSLGAFGIFAASGIAAVIACVVSLWVLMRKFQFVPMWRIDRTVLQEVKSFSFSSYAANLLNIIPTLVLPIIILTSLGAPAAAYYYVSFMIATVLYTGAYAVSQSLFAEGSYEEHDHTELLWRAIRILGIVIGFGTALMTLTAPWLLRVFGAEYAENAASLLRLLALAAPAVTLYVVVNVLLRLQKQYRAIIIINSLYLLIICGAAMLTAGHGLVMIGWAWLAGNCFSGLAGILYLLRKPA